MDKKVLMEQFRANHEELMEYVDQLTNTEFTTSTNGKWTPGQQLEHVYLCLIPIAKVLPSKTLIQEKFGVINRVVWNYDEVIHTYKNALSQGGKAPEKFIPAEVGFDKKAALIQDTTSILSGIGQSLDSYTEEELDSLVLPHPLLGKLSIRELFFLMGYHATHHLDQTKLNLAVRS